MSFKPARCTTSAYPVVRTYHECHGGACALSQPAPPPRPTLSSNCAGQFHSVLDTLFCNYLFPSLSTSLSSSFFLFQIPSGDRLASIVFLFEVSFPPNIDDAAPRLPLFPFFLAAAWALFLFIFSEAGFVFLCWPKRDLSFLCGASGQIQSS